MNQQKIGRFISENRKNQGLTQAELAEKLGVSNRAVSKWENGRSMPDVSIMLPIKMPKMQKEKLAKKDYRKRIK